MKDTIHPTYHTDAVVTCSSCKTTWKTGSTKEELHTEICSQCHPFYTGKQHLIDTAGTVDRFKKKQELAAKAQAVVKEKKPRKVRGSKA